VQGRNRRLASDVQSLQRQLDAKDAAMSQMQDRIRQNEGDMKSKDTLVKQLEDDIFRSAALCTSNPCIGDAQEHDEHTS